jgi:hypothetical protein
MIQGHRNAMTVADPAILLDPFAETILQPQFAGSVD